MDGLKGRRVLTAPTPEILDSKEVGKILDRVLPKHFENSEEIEYLHNFVGGDQPILERTKSVRDEIMNIVIENRAYEIVEFKKGYEFSHPIQYTNAGQDDTAPIELLNKFAKVDGKEEKDLALAEWMYISGNCYRFCNKSEEFTEDNAPYYTSVLDPRTTFVVYSTGVSKKMLVAGVYTQNGDVYLCDAYTDSKTFSWEITEEEHQEIVKGSEEGVLVSKRCEEESHIIGMIPIVEYYLNPRRMGYIELCLGLFNVLNTAQSNRADGIEQFIQSYLVFVNADIPDELDDKGRPVIENGQKVKKLPKSGDAILVGNQQGNADVKFIESMLSQEDTQIFKDDILRAIHEICGVPDRHGKNQGGGDRAQAVVLRNGWGDAEARAKTTENMFRKSEYEYLMIVLKICRDTQGVEIDNLVLHDIDIKFSRNRNDQMVTKAQALKMLLDCDINPEDAFITSELFSDPSAVWLRSKEIKEANDNAKRVDEISTMLADGYIDEEWAIANNPMIKEADKKAVLARIDLSKREDAEETFETDDDIESVEDNESKE